MKQPWNQKNIVIFDGHRFIQFIVFGINPVKTATNRRVRPRALSAQITWHNPVNISNSCPPHPDGHGQPPNYGDSHSPTQSFSQL